jgi:hypothetical protein
MGVTAEGTFMSDENENKAGLPSIKGDGPFCFCL